jgi:hypothetical protein
MGWRSALLLVFLLLSGGCGYQVDVPASFEEQAAAARASDGAETATAPVVQSPTEPAEPTEAIDPLDQPIRLPPDAEVIAAAWEAMVADGTVAFTIREEIEAGTGTPVPYLVEGFGDLRGGRTRTTVSGEGLEPSLSITDPTGTWWRDPELPPETPWRFLPNDVALDAFGGRAAPDDGRLAMFSGFPQSVSTATEVGREDLGGRQVTRYDAVVDLQRAAQRQQGPSEALQLLETGQTELPMQVWIGDDGRIARLAFALEFVASNGVPEIVVTVDYSDYGIAADFTPPPAEQVSDVQPG